MLTEVQAACQVLVRENVLLELGVRAPQVLQVHEHHSRVSKGQPVKGVLVAGSFHAEREVLGRLAEDLSINVSHEDNIDICFRCAERRALHNIVQADEFHARIHNSRPLPVYST
jgi:hypothetical protein